MRLLVIALVLVWASPARGQAAFAVMAGDTVRVLADHDGADTDGYRLSINGAETPVQIAADVLANGTVTFDLSVVAVNGAGEAPSDAITVAVVLPPTPTPPPLTDCPYVNQQGILTPKPIGDDSVHGWNVIDPLNLADVKKTYTRRKQLESWGLDYQILATDDGFHKFTDGLPRIYIYAPCVGVRASGAQP